jgi:chemotaxis protein methyltransferase CheR
MSAIATSPGGEFAYTDDDFRNIARLLYDETGIHLPPSKATLVYSRIAKRLRALGLENFRDYCALVGEAAGADEKAHMLSALTTNVTRFFREPHHFEHLKTKLLPPLLDAARRGQRLRIWSAGCSSGQEPYSIALTILSLLPDARSYNIRILATDINPHVVATGRKAIYPAEEVEEVPAELRRTWMDEVRKEGERVFQLDDAARSLVSFRELNLMGNWPMKGAFNAIFCRNVVIYFDEQTQMRVWNRMMPLLEPGGYLYIGHSERLIGPAQAQLRIDGTTCYRKAREAAP